MIGIDKKGLALLFLPPLFVGIILGANQTRAGAYLPWLLSIGYWVTLSLVTWWLLALGTMAARLMLRPWSPPAWFCWLTGAVLGSLAARPLIYAIASALRPFMEAPMLREMPPTTLTLEFLWYYLTNWSVIIFMWLSACWLEAKWRSDEALHTAPTPEAGLSNQAVTIWETQSFLSRIPPNLGREILALHSEDHYVRVYTQEGDTLLLAAISDAVQAVESSGQLGQRVHRSWWIANAAVSGSKIRDRRTIIFLKNGIEVPVSQTYREVARLSGLLNATPQGA